MESAGEIDRSAEFKVKGEAVILTLASAVSVTAPDLKVNGSEPIITLAASPVTVGGPTDKVNALSLTLILTLPTNVVVANGNAAIASNPKLINNP